MTRTTIMKSTNAGDNDDNDDDDKEGHRHR